MVDALVPTGEEGRSKLRKASESCKRAKTRGFPNGITWHGRAVPPQPESIGLRSLHPLK